MKAIGYAGKQFADLNVKAGWPAGQQPGPSRNPVSVDRAGAAPLYATVNQDERRFTVEFTVKSGYDTQDTLLTLLGVLDPTSSEERIFVAEIEGGGARAGTQVEIPAIVGQYRRGTINNLYVDFYAADDRWVERVATTVAKQSFSASGAIPLPNRGGATVGTVVKLGYDTQRASDTATVGWKWRRQLTVTNSGTTNWRRVRLTFDLGDTSAWVAAGKAQADGDDVRIWLEGQELPRTLTCFGAEQTWAHVVASIPAGDSLTFDVVYGNPSATAPDDLSTRTGNDDTYAADDLEGDSGTASAGSVSTLTDATKTWETDEWKNGFCLLTSGTGSVRARRIAGNTGQVITFNRNQSSAPGAGTKYILWKSGVFKDGGRVTGGVTSTAIQDTAHTNKWAPSSLKGATVTFHGGTANPSTMTVSDNTTDTITFSSGFSVNPSVNDSFTITRWGALNWNVDRTVFERTHRGLWRINKYHSAGAKVRYGDQTPGGWVPWLMLDNQDDFAQGRYVDEGSGGGHAVNNWPYLYARRSVRSDNTWPEKGIADGACLFDPRGFVAFDWCYQMKNENGLGKVVVMTQEPGGEDWQTQASDATTRAALVDVTSGGASGAIAVTGDLQPVRIYTGVQPVDGVEVPSTEKKSRSIELRNAVRLLAWLDIANAGGLSGGMWSAGAEAAMYHMNATVRLGGGASATPPYDKIVTGPRFGLASGQRLWVNPDPTPGAPLFGLYDSSDMLVSRVPWAATIERHEYDADGVDTAVVARALAPLPVAVNLITTGEDSTTGWTLTNSAGVTASIANESTTKYDGGATSLKVTVTTTPAGAWTITLTRTAGRIAVIPGAMEEFGLAYRRNSLTNAITCQYSVAWTYGGGTASAVDGTSTIGSAMATADQWYTAGGGRKIHPGSAATPATTEATISIVIAGTGSTSGTVYLDQILLGVINAYLAETAMGTLNTAFAWTESYHE